MQALWTSSWRSLREQPALFVSRSWAIALLLWSQDVVPWIGAAVAAFFILLCLHSLRRPWGRVSWPRVIFLTSFLFPMVFLWRVIASWILNTDWLILNSRLWAASALFFLALAHLYVAIAVDGMDSDDGLDAWLARSAKRLIKSFSPAVFVSFFFAVLSLLALATGGYGFAVLAPLALALQGSIVRSSLEAEAGERT